MEQVDAAHSTVNYLMITGDAGKKSPVARDWFTDAVIQINQQVATVGKNTHKTAKNNIININKMK